MSISLPGKALCLSLMLVGLWAPAQLRADDTDFDQSMAQARIFLKKGWYRDATKELRRAVGTSQGEKSYDAHILLAQSCYKEFDIGCSLNMAEEARTLARTPEERNSSQNVLDYFQRNYGKVEFQAGPGELTEGYLELEPQDPILDRDVKMYFKEKVAPLAEQRRSLPWIMYLPAISWKMYGKEFTVEGGKELTVNAGFNAENAAPKPEKAPPPPDFDGVGVALQLRIGGGVALGTGASAPELGPVAEVSVHKSLTELIAAGLFAKFNYDLVQIDSTNAPALTFGAVGTAHIVLTDHLSFLPAVGYSYGRGPATMLNDCSVNAVEGGEQLVCGEGSGNLSAALAIQKMHGPIARAELAYEKRGEKSIMGGQLGVQAQYGIAGDLSEGRGAFNQSGAVAENYVYNGPAVHPLRVELLAGFNMTF